MRWDLIVVVGFVDVDANLYTSFCLISSRVSFWRSRATDQDLNEARIALKFDLCYFYFQSTLSRCLFAIALQQIDHFSHSALTLNF